MKLKYTEYTLVVFMKYGAENAPAQFLLTFTKCLFKKMLTKNNSNTLNKVKQLV